MQPYDQIALTRNHTNIESLTCMRYLYYLVHKYHVHPLNHPPTHRHTHAVQSHLKQENHRCSKRSTHTLNPCSYRPQQVAYRAAGYAHQRPPGSRSPCKKPNIGNNRGRREKPARVTAYQTLSAFPACGPCLPLLFLFLSFRCFSFLFRLFPVNLPAANPQPACPSPPCFF